MTDIARIGIAIDTSDVKIATGRLADLHTGADETGDAIEDLERKTTRYNNRLKNSNKNIGTAADNFGRMGSNARSAGKNTGRFGQIAGQAGYQIGDFAVQVQGGQSALLAFSQQGSQLLGAFGAWGAIAGAVLSVGAAVGGVLFKSLQAGGESIDDYAAKVQDLTGDLEKLNKTQLEAAATKGQERLLELAELRKEAEKERIEFVDAGTKGLLDAEKEYEDYYKRNRKKSFEDTGARYESIVKSVKKHNEEYFKYMDAVGKVANIDKEIADINRDILKSQGYITGETQAEKAETEMLAQINAEILELEKDQAKQREQTAKDAEKEALALQKILERNEALNETLDRRNEADFEAEKASNIAFLQSILDKNKSETDILNEHHTKIKNMEHTFAKDEVLRKQALAAIEGQIEEEKTKKAEEENLKRKQMVAGYFQDASDIMSTFNDFMSLSSIGRKQTLEDELRNNKSLSAEQVKNKEAELRGIFNQEKNAKKNSILMSTAAGVMTQLATGNFVAAAKVGAAGAVNYAKVNATSFKSPAPAPSSPVSSSPQQTTSNITFDFSNIPSNAMISPDGLVDMMKQSLRDAKLNGEVI